MAAMSTTMGIAGSAVAAPVTGLSSSDAFGASSEVRQLGAVRSSAGLNGSRMVAVRASQRSHEEQSPVKSTVLVALVAAGAALALNVAPVSPAHAGLFGSDNVKVERGATAPDFPGNEGTGTKVGSNSDVRGSANSGTPLGEGAGGNLVGDNQATRQASSTGTPLGEGSLNTGSGVNLGDALQNVPDLPNPLSKVGELNPLKGGLPDASNVVGDAKDALQRKVAGAKDMAENAKSTVSNGGLPDPSTVASEVASSEGAQNAKSAAGEVAKNAAQTVATNSAQELVEGAKSNAGLPNPMDAGKALMRKLTGN
ncbi:hypothetical protein KC19_7G042100 [Ceratodon purpureus]|uniref:Uncharacterized protein n=1 Tax=Ceratodon purpureus TaxID=3225 RepID=A0A8T0H218_CERPU|nr:hypothetical protein KC19_7G042100 [Ceratodon purpureus]